MAIGIIFYKFKKPNEKQVYHAIISVPMTPSLNQDSGQMVGGVLGHPSRLSYATSPTHPPTHPPIRYKLTLYTVTGGRRDTTGGRRDAAGVRRDTTGVICVRSRRQVSGMEQLKYM